MNGLHFVPLKGYLNDSEFFGIPFISNDGIAIVPIDGESVTAFRLGTGAKLWTYKTPAYLGALFPTGGISAYILSESVANTGIGASTVLKLDVATGQLDTSQSVPGDVTASPVSIGGYVFVPTNAGLFTYDVDLNLVASFQLTAGGASPALSSNGDVFLISADGYLYRFPGAAAP
jgi:outer membrane protein assembly factor BamB